MATFNCKKDYACSSSLCGIKQLHTYCNNSISLLPYEDNISLYVSRSRRFKETLYKTYCGSGIRSGKKYEMNDK